MQIQTSRRVTEPREKTTAFVKAGGVKCRHRGLAAAQHKYPIPSPRSGDSFSDPLSPQANLGADVVGIQSHSTTTLELIWKEIDCVTHVLYDSTEILETSVFFVRIVVVLRSRSSKIVFWERCGPLAMLRNRFLLQKPPKSTGHYLLIWGNQSPEMIQKMIYDSAITEKTDFFGFGKSCVLTPFWIPEVLYDSTITPKTSVKMIYRQS